MLRSLVCAQFALLLAALAARADDPQSLFNGKDLSGWEGDPAIWSVEDGAIVGRLTDDKPLESNTFLIWQGGNVANFRLRLQYKIEGGNSGIQYRSRVLDAQQFIVAGYQADIDAADRYTGILYDEQGRGILAERGQRVKIGPGGHRDATSFADAAELQKSINANDWNDYIVVARGPRLRHKINGKLMSETLDRERGKRAEYGVLALQVHRGPPMTVWFKNIRLEKLEPHIKKKNSKSKRE
jgi:hypothetical protein